MPTGFEYETLDTQKALVRAIIQLNNNISSLTRQISLVNEREEAKAQKQRDKDNKLDE